MYNHAYVYIFLSDTKNFFASFKWINNFNENSKILLFFKIEIEINK